MTGFDSKRQMAQDKVAQPAQESVMWRNAAIRLGEELSSVGPDGYYDMTAEQWFDWAMEQEPRGKNSLAQPAQELQVRTNDCLLVGVCASEGHKIQAQRPWVGLTEEERHYIFLGIEVFGLSVTEILLEAEAKLKEKNT